MNCSYRDIFTKIIGTPIETMDAKSSKPVKKKVSNGYTIIFA